MNFRSWKIKIDPADRIFSLYIRLRDGRCMRCGKRGEPDKDGRPVVGLENSHYFGRWMEGTRFDPDNCITLCHGCHSFWERDRDDYRAFMINRLKSENAFKILEWRARGYCKKDRTLALIRAKELLKSVEHKNQ
jgi:hypothetical protein